MLGAGHALAIATRPVEQDDSDRARGRATRSRDASRGSADEQRRTDSSHMLEQRGEVDVVRHLAERTENQ
jgi:hypothetical protein